MEKNNTCLLCHKYKSNLQCTVCTLQICKHCAQFTHDSDFSFLPKIPEVLSLGTYCGPCFDEKIAPEMEKYNLVLEQARDIIVYMKSQGKETRLIKSTHEAYRVKDCPDRSEVILRLAFFAVLDGFNGLIDVDVRSEKVKVGTYQKYNWSGSGKPVQLVGRRYGNQPEYGGEDISPLSP